jgi:peptidoglycan/LPS O-acetylase OafA/YrhL
LYPLHLVTTIGIVLLYLVIPKAFPSYEDGSLYSLACYLFLIQGLGFRKLSDGDWNYPSWAISVEFWGNLIFAAFLRGKSKFFYLFLASFIYVIIFSVEGNLSSFSYNYFNILNSGLLRGIAGMALGVFLGHLRENNTPTLPKTFWHLSEGFSLLTLALLISLPLEKPYQFTDFVTLPVITFVLLIFSFEKGFISGLIARSKIHQIGVYAFAAYLIHVPVIHFVYDVIGPARQNFFYWFASLTILGAWLGHHLIENPTKAFFKEKEPMSLYLWSLLGASVILTVYLIVQTFFNP